MARYIRFVDYEYSQTGGSSGNVTLDLHDCGTESPAGICYCVDEIEFPPPEPRIEWRDPAHLDGREVNRYKYENRIITIRMNIYGIDEATLAQNIRNLWEQCFSERLILEFKPDTWTESLFFDLITPPISINPEDWFQTWLREYRRGLYVLPNLELEFEAQPFGRMAEEEIWLARGLGVNDSFENWTGAPPNEDPDDWAVTETNSGTVTKNSTAGQRIDGAYSCQLQTTAGGTDVAAVTDDDFIPVDETHHYNNRICALRVGAGAVAFDCDVACYDNVPALLGTLNMLVGDNVDTSWEDPIEKSANTGVIHPSAEGDPFSFPVGTTQVKRTFRNDSAVASVCVIDSAWFGDTELFERACTIAGSGGDTNRFEIPARIEIPDIRGDVPSPARLAFKQPEDTEEIIYSRVGIGGGLVMKPTDLKSLTYAIGYLDQWYDTDAVPFFTYHFPWVNTETYRGRYFPVLRFYWVPGATVTDFHMSQEWRRVSTGITFATTYYDKYFTIDASGGSGWRISGTDDTVLIDPMVPAEIPSAQTLDDVDMSDIETRIVLECSGPTGGFIIDYLALIPCDRQIVNIDCLSADAAEGFALGKRLYQIPEEGEVDEPDSFIFYIGDYIGDVPFMVEPGDDALTILATGTEPSNTTPYSAWTHPYSKPDILLTYSPRFLLVPEE